MRRKQNIRQLQVSRHGEAELAKIDSDENIVHARTILTIFVQHSVCSQ